jgi:hypothetical protein
MQTCAYCIDSSGARELLEVDNMRWFKDKKKILAELRQILGRSDLNEAVMIEYAGKLSGIETNLDESVEVVHCPRSGVWVVIPKKEAPNA